MSDVDESLKRGYEELTKHLNSLRKKYSHLASEKAKRETELQKTEQVIREITADRDRWKRLAEEKSATLASYGLTN